MRLDHLPWTRFHTEMCWTAKGGFKGKNFQTYIACHEEIYQKMTFLKTAAGTFIFLFLIGTYKSFLKISKQINKSQPFYSTIFNANSSYLASMVLKTSASKRVNIAAAMIEVDSV